MRKKPSSILREILITCLTFFMLSPVTAQKEKEEPLISQEQVKKINDIVKPLKDQFDKQLSGDKIYAAYLADVKKITAAKTMEEKSSLTAKLDGKYLVFFQKLWSDAKVDEKTYQQKIRGVFPVSIAGLIQFDIFLGFSLQVSSYITLPPPPPLPPNKCIDICPIAAGEITGDGLLISGGGGSYGNCYIKTFAWAAAAGLNKLDGNFKNNVTIPGTFPDDARKLRVKKSYQLKLEATSFAAGGGFAGAVLKTNITDESVYVYAPILGFKHKLYYKTINEEYTLEKRQVEKSIFRVWSNVDSWFISGSWSKSECTAITWSICEETIQ